LAFCLALLNQEYPDLASVVKCWPDLPENIRAAISELIKIRDGGRV